MSESEITCSRVCPLGFFECVDCESNDPLCLIYWPCGLWCLALEKAALHLFDPVNALAAALSPAWRV